MTKTTKEQEKLNIRVKEICKNYSEQDLILASEDKNRSNGNDIFQIGVETSKKEDKAILWTSRVNILSQNCKRLEEDGYTIISASIKREFVNDGLWASKVNFKKNNYYRATIVAKKKVK